MYYYGTTFFSLFLLPLLPSTSLATSIPQVLTRHCGTEDPSPGLLFAHSYLSWAEPLDNDFYNASTVNERIYSRKSRKKRQVPSPLFTIDTYMHIVADNESAQSNSSAYVTDSQVRAQFEYLVEGYADAGIAFRLLGYTRVMNDTWARNGDDLAMKRALRRGSYSTLNIYYQSKLQATPGTQGVPTGTILLGLCFLPSGGVRSNTPAAAYVSDGCNILSSTMPGGALTLYNSGGSTVHEVGHWNGLLHTFEGNSCATDDYGDYVADTPQEATSTRGCPATKDSCPNSGAPAGFDGSNGSTNPYGAQGYSGPDPINNFMDYSADACYSNFTPGQGARMLNIWQIYRQGR